MGTRRQKKLSEEEKRKRYDQYLQGYSHAELGKLWGIKEASVTMALSNLRRDLGDERRPQRNPATKPRYKDPAEAERMRRYEMRHTSEALLDRFLPRWREGMDRWPPKDGPCSCGECGREFKEKWE